MKDMCTKAAVIFNLCSRSCLKVTLLQQTTKYFLANFVVVVVVLFSYFLHFCPMTNIPNQIQIAVMLGGCSFNTGMDVVDIACTFNHF